MKKTVIIEKRNPSFIESAFQIVPRSITKTTEVFEDHFEYQENNADIFDAAAQQVPAFGLVRSLGSLFGGGPDIDQRVRDYNTYIQQGKVLGGNPKDVDSWIWNIPYYQKHPEEGFSKDGRVNNPVFIKRYQDFIASQAPKPAAVQAPTAGMMNVNTPTSQPAPTNAPTFTSPSTSTTPQPGVNPNVPSQGQGSQAGASLLQSGASFTSSTWIMVAVGGVIVLALILFLANR